VHPLLPCVSTELDSLCRAAHPLLISISNARADRHDAESHHNLLHELLQELHKSDVPKDLFKESELVVARPREVVGMVQAVNEAEGYVFTFMT
jgi:hypothetical protein